MCLGWLAKVSSVRLVDWVEPQQQPPCGHSVLMNVIIKTSLATEIHKLFTLVFFTPWYGTGLKVAMSQR